MMCNGILHMRSRVSTAGCDMFCYWTIGEMDYLEGLNGQSNDRIEGWSGCNIVARDAWVWPKAQVLVDFRYIQKQGVFWDG